MGCGWVKETAVRSCDDKMVQSQLFSDHGGDRECLVRSVYTGSLRLMLSPNTQMKARKHSLRVSALFIVACISHTITCNAKPIEPKTQKKTHANKLIFRLILQFTCGRHINSGSSKEHSLIAAGSIGCWVS